MKDRNLGILAIGICLLTACNDADIGIIGGADGPTSIIVGEQKEGYSDAISIENMALDEGRAYIERYANERGTDCIRNIYWEDLLETTLHVVSCVPELFDYYTKFKEKYFG